jgi:hypothetical protein
MTSIEWLEQIAKSMVINGGDLGEDYPALLVHIQQAKEMHKQEITKAFDEGQEYEYQYHINNAPKFDSETYYQETFGSGMSEKPNSQTNEMYSQEEVYHILVEHTAFLFQGCKSTLTEWFEKFKKK